MAAATTHPAARGHPSRASKRKNCSRHRNFTDRWIYTHTHTHTHTHTRILPRGKVESCHPGATTGVAQEESTKTSYAYYIQLFIHHAIDNGWISAMYSKAMLRSVVTQEYIQQWNKYQRALASLTDSWVEVRKTWIQVDSPEPNYYWRAQSLWLVTGR